MRHYNTTIDSALSKLRHLTALGGSGGDIPPLSRESFIDNGSQGGTGDGSIASPFKTITGWITTKATPRVSNADAEASQVGLLCQSIGGYANEAVSFPPYASTELRGFASPAQPVGLEIESLTWNNVAGAHAPGAAIGQLTDVSVANGVTYTDDVGAPGSELLLISSYSNEMKIVGPITATGVHSLEAIFIKGVACLGGIDTDTEVITQVGTAVETSVAAFGWIAFGTAINVGTIDLVRSGSFANCVFGSASAPVLTCASATNAIVFDGGSMRAFLAAGGTVAAGTLVTVVGGYDACGYEGPNGVLPAAGDAVVSIDGQAAGTTQADGGNAYFVAPTAAHSCQIKNSGESPFDTICITKTNAAGDGAYSILNDAGAVVAIMPAGSMGFVVMQKQGADWVPIRSGSGVTI
jgi:hypothetical protein